MADEMGPKEFRLTHQEVAYVFALYGAMYQEPGDERAALFKAATLYLRLRYELRRGLVHKESEEDRVVLHMTESGMTVRGQGPRMPLLPDGD